jgi:hypothetical protein
MVNARAAAKRAHGKGSQTPKQLKAERANLVLARAALKGVKRTQTAAMHAAEVKNLVKARAAEVKKHGKGHQTPKQLAAERRNLAKARAKEKLLGIGWYKKRHHGSYHSSAYRNALYGGVNTTGLTGRHANKFGKEVLGSHRINASLTHHLTIPKPTGINPRFKRRIAPTSFDTRTSWKASHAHHSKKRLRLRKSRVAHVGHWRSRARRRTPK